MPIDTGQILATRNKLTQEEVKRFRESLRVGSRKAVDYHDLKHRYPFMGFVNCQVNLLNFLMFSANDDVVAWEYFWLGHDSYETKTVETWVDLSREADKIVDIGAYTGLMSIIAALSNPNAEIFAFEAMERTLERLKINISINGLPKRIQTFGIAASDKVETKEINLYREENFLGTGNSFQEKDGIPILAKKNIPTAPVDNILPDASAQLVKIDVEGHEVAVLKGMNNLIRRSRPKMIVEVWKHNWGEINEFARDLGYKIDRIEGMNYLFEPK